MKARVSILFCLAVLFCSCSSSGSADNVQSWREIERFEGSEFTLTRQFTVDASFWRLSWSTQSDAEGKKRFRLEVSEPASSAVADRYAHDDSPDEGSVIIHKNGRLYLQIDARQPFVVRVEVPE